MGVVKLRGGSVIYEGITVINFWPLCSLNGVQSISPSSCTTLNKQHACLKQGDKENWKWRNESKVERWGETLCRIQKETDWEHKRGSVRIDRSDKNNKDKESKRQSSFQPGLSMRGATLPPVDQNQELQRGAVGSAVCYSRLHLYMGGSGPVSFMPFGCKQVTFDK